MIIGISGKISSGKDTIGVIIQYLTCEMNDTSHKELYEILEGKKPIFIDCTWKIKKYATALKKCVSVMTGISLEELEKEEVKNSELPESFSYWEVDNNDPSNPCSARYTNELEARECALFEYGHAPTVTYKSMAVRQLLQEVGTNVCRNIHENIWVNALMSEYKEDVYIESESSDIKDCYYHPNWIITDVRFENELQAIKDRNGITIRVDRNIDTTIIFSTHVSETALDSAVFDYIIHNNGTIEELIEKVKNILIKEQII